MSLFLLPASDGLFISLSLHFFSLSYHSPFSQHPGTFITSPSQHLFNLSCLFSIFQHLTVFSFIFAPLHLHLFCHFPPPSPHLSIFFPPQPFLPCSLLSFSSPFLATLPGIVSCLAPFTSCLRSCVRSNPLSPLHFDSPSRSCYMLGDVSLDPFLPSLLLNFIVAIVFSLPCSFL